MPLRALVAEAVDAARVRDDERRWLVEDGPEAGVTGDPSSLRRLLDNLLANGAAHTPPGTTVVVRVGSESGAVVIEVTDDGPGLPARMSDDPFDRFTRGPAASDTTPRSGSGLGLAIVRAIAEAHGGTATITATEPARGLTVRVRLPLHDPG